MFTRSPRSGSVVVTLLALAGVAGVSREAAAQQPVLLHSNIALDPTSLVPGSATLRFKTGSGTIFGPPAVSPDGRNWCFVADNDSGSSASDSSFVVHVGAAAASPLREGDPFTGMGALEFENLGIFRGYGINNAGQWAVANNTSAATTSDEIIIRGGDAPGIRVHLREGQTHPAYAGETVGALLDAVSVLADGRIAYWNSAVSGTTGTTAKQGWFLDTTALTKADDAATQPAGQQFAPAQTWDNFSNSLRVNAAGTHWSGLGDLNGATSQDNVAVVDNTVVLQEGGQLPGVTGGSLLQGVASSQTMIRSGGLGHWIARGTTVDGIGYVVVGQIGANSGVVVARENQNILGDPLEQYTGQGTATNSADPTSFRGVAMNNLGDYVVNALTNDPNGEGNVVVLNNQRIVLRRNASVTGHDPELGTLKLGRIGDTNIGDDMALTDDGRLYFTAELTGPATGGAASSGVLVVRVFCGIADVASLGGSIGRDNQLSVDDIVVFLQAFFGGNLAVADVAGLGGAPGPDGALTVDDIVVFLAAFFAGC